MWGVKNERRKKIKLSNRTRTLAFTVAAAVVVVYFFFLRATTTTTMTNHHHHQLKKMKMKHFVCLACVCVCVWSSNLVIDEMYFFFVLVGIGYRTFLCVCVWLLDRSIDDDYDDDDGDDDINRSRYIHLGSGDGYKKKNFFLLACLLFGWMAIFFYRFFSWYLDYQIGNWFFLVLCLCMDEWIVERNSRLNLDIYENFFFLSPDDGQINWEGLERRTHHHHHHHPHFRSWFIQLDFEKKKIKISLNWSLFFSIYWKNPIHWYICLT